MVKVNYQLDWVVGLYMESFAVIVSSKNDLGDQYCVYVWVMIKCDDYGVLVLWQYLFIISLIFIFYGFWFGIFRMVGDLLFNIQIECEGFIEGSFYNFIICMFKYLGIEFVIFFRYVESLFLLLKVYVSI